MVYEAHSTDYQTRANLRALVRRHFAMLKVGPALTFALREALWALALIEREWLPPERSSGLRETVLAAMAANPRHWEKYYLSTGAQLLLDQQYSLSDRVRYYWPVPAVEQALDAPAGESRARSAAADAAEPVPAAQYAAVRAGSPRRRTRASWCCTTWNWCCSSTHPRAGVLRRERAVRD